MKKTVAFILAAVMLVCVASCGKGTDTETYHEITVTSEREGVATIVTRYVFDKDDVLDVVYQTAEYTDMEQFEKDYEEIGNLTALFGDLKRDGNVMSYYLTKDCIHSFYPDFDYQKTLDYVKENDMDYTVKE